MQGIRREAVEFLIACLSGAVIYLAYQLLYLFRKIAAHSQLAVDTEDLFYWLAVSGYLFHQMYITTYGRIRWYFIIGVVCGAAAAKIIFSCGKTIYIKMQKSLEKITKKR